MKYYFIVNPVAGPGVAENKIKTQIASLKEEVDYEIHLTKANKDATKYVSQVITENPNKEICFIACGGDGTINEVFEPCVLKENVYVSLIPTGSGNDFVKCFKGKEFNIENIVHGQKKQIDVFKVNDRICVNVMNFGIDSSIAKYVNDGRAKRGYGKKSDYIVGALRSLFSSMKSEVEIYGDGKLLNPDGIITSVTFSNGQYVGGSFNCAPRSKLDDGLIDVCIIKGVGVLEFARFVVPYSKGKHLDDPAMQKLIIYSQVKELKVIAKDPNFFYSLDGEIIKNPHMECGIIKQALNLIVPR